MTQQQAFELIKQTVLRRKGDLDKIYISANIILYRQEDGEEIFETWFTVEDDGREVVRSEFISEVVPKINHYYNKEKPLQSVTTNGELPNLAS